jgi:hypothetical protein
MGRVNSYVIVVRVVAHVSSHVLRSAYGPRAGLNAEPVCPRGDCPHPLPSARSPRSWVPSTEEHHTDGLRARGTREHPATPGRQHPSSQRRPGQPATRHRSQYPATYCRATHGARCRHVGRVPAPRGLARRTTCVPQLLRRHTPAASAGSSLRQY